MRHGDVEGEEGVVDLGGFRSRVGVAVTCLPSRRWTCINAKSSLEFAKFLKMQNQYAKLLERCFCEFWQKSRIQKEYAKLFEMLGNENGSSTPLFKTYTDPKVVY